MFSLLKLKLLFLCGKKSVLDDVDFDFSIKNILAKGKGILSELTSKHVVLNEISSKLLNIIDEDENDEEINKNESSKIDKENGKILLKYEANREFYGFTQSFKYFFTINFK